MTFGKDQYFGCAVLAAQHTNHFEAQDNTQGKYPHGHPRGGEDEGPTRTDNQMTKIARNTEEALGNAVCSCGKVCKNNRGLKIHQGRMKCSQAVQVEQRTVTQITGETERNPSQEANHSAENPKVSAEMPKTLKSITRKTTVKWPPMSKNKEWEMFEEDVNKILDTALIGSVERKLQTLPTIIHSIGRDRFGIVERKNTPKNKPNHREERVNQIRKDLRILQNRWKTCQEREKEGIKQLGDELREKLKSKRRAEYYRKKRKKKEKARQRFINNPYKFTSELLGKPKGGTLESTMEEVEEHLRQTHSDIFRETELGNCENLMIPETPQVQFNMKEPTLVQLTEIVRKARSKSDPGYSGTSYKVYKKCPLLLGRLYKLIKVVWRQQKIPECWQYAEDCLIPKEENSRHIKQFRTISLLSVEGKIFFSLMSQRMTAYILENNYLDVSVQKGGIPGFAGCLEHTSVLTQLIKEARDNKELSVVWLDLTNAYGPIPHKLVAETLNRYHVPNEIQNMLAQYYERCYIRFNVGERTTNWQRLEKGIITGCTISVIIFASAVNLIVKSAEKECKGPLMRSGIRQAPVKAFMDDLTLATQFTVQTRWLLKSLEVLIKWARMKFNPKKSRSDQEREGVEELCV